ncbi:hypothetical protein P154DRAFT_423897, partial [Amniculicola lignicola CBS 123094]
FFYAQTLTKSYCNAGMVFSLNLGGLYAEFLSNALRVVLTTTLSIYRPPISNSPIITIQPSNYPVNNSSYKYFPSALSSIPISNVASLANPYLTYLIIALSISL